MRTLPASFPALCAALLATIPFVHAQEASIPASAATGARVIVKLKPGSPVFAKAARDGLENEAAVAAALGERIGVPLAAGAAIAERTQVLQASGLTSAALAARLASEPDVAFAVPDRRRRAYGAPNDPLYGEGVPGTGPAAGQWYLRAATPSTPAAIDAERAWSVTMGDPSVVVAVLDTGVRFDHPDLSSFVAQGGNILPGYDMIADAAAANDGDGRDPDASDPGDWVTAAEANNASSPFYQCTTKDPASGKYVAENSKWHGTMTSSLIGALTNNGFGMASVSANVRVLPVRVLGKCGGFDSDIIAGMRWAAGLSVPHVPPNLSRANVINLSLGGEDTCNSAYQSAVDEVLATGSVIIVAAGNSAGHRLSTPANCRGVIGVAALRHAGSKVGFSDLGPDVTLSAPGGNCVNTAPGMPCLYPILAATDTGDTTPVVSTFTDSYKISVGTSFSAPLVAGTAALMLSANPALSPWQLRQMLQASARPFPTTGGDNGDNTVVPQCTAPQYDAGGSAVDQLQCYCTTSACGAGMLDAGAAVAAAKNGIAIAPVQAQGLWWNAPASSESGWGINLAHQGDVIFATWFTYDPLGNAWWLSMTGNKVAENVYTGDLYETHGPAFDAVPFDVTQVRRSAVGRGTLSFTSDSAGIFSYTANGTTDTKAITRQVYGALPHCATATAGSLAAATNYQDLWWSDTESGWGLNITQQSDVIFATWFSYDATGNPTWLSGTARNAGGRTYSGTLVRTSGPGFDAVPFRPAGVKVANAGSFTLSFSDGNNATFAYQVGDVSRSKHITRQVFRAPGTLCQ